MVSEVKFMRKRIELKTEQDCIDFLMHILSNWGAFCSSHPKVATSVCFILDRINEMQKEIVSLNTQKEFLNIEICRLKEQLKRGR